METSVLMLFVGCSRALEGIVVCFGVDCFGLGGFQSACCLSGLGRVLPT